MAKIIYDRELTRADRLLLNNLEDDILEAKARAEKLDNNTTDNDDDFEVVDKDDGVSEKEKGRDTRAVADRDAELITYLTALNDPASSHFEPTVFTSIDLPDIKLPPFLQKYVFEPYLKLAQKAVRTPTDAVMFTHIVMYFTTSVPSAIYLYYNFRLWHGILHALMQLSYVGSYTLLMHQHIHQRGVLTKALGLFDDVFPYVTNLLMGHTWNSYYYHHVKHHHIEGNGPHDLSSTIRYQRDDPFHFLLYLGRFFFLVWIDLPFYFIRKRRYTLAVKTAFWEWGSYVFYTAVYRLNSNATWFVFLVPLIVMRLGLMIGNWGQHALVDHDEPDSDFRSSVTLIDVPSNRHCFNDGYHTSHHLNPLRHWRDHPVSFLKAKETYSSQHALVFHNIDYLMMTVRLLIKDYDTLADCLVPIGSQMDMTKEEKKALLRRCTLRFTEEEIKEKFGKK